MLSWWKLAGNLALTGLEARRVIALRLLKLAHGGPAAVTEASLMVTEKARASVGAATTLMAGRNPNTMP
jgi:hypothetical protein